MLPIKNGRLLFGTGFDLLHRATNTTDNSITADLMLILNIESEFSPVRVRTVTTCRWIARVPFLLVAVDQIGCFSPRRFYRVYSTVNLTRALASGETLSRRYPSPVFPLDFSKGNQTPDVSFQCAPLPSPLRVDCDEQALTLYAVIIRRCCVEIVFQLLIKMFEKTSL